MRALFLIALTVLVTTVFPCAAQTEEKRNAFHRVLLTSAKANKRVGAFRLSQEDLPRVGPGPWSIRQLPLRGGKQEGVELIRIDNGKLRITVVPTRGLSVLD